MIPIQTTTEYPVRYVAFEHQGTLWENADTKAFLNAGGELAVFCDDAYDLYGSITSYQGDSVMGEVVQNGRGVNIEGYSYENMKKNLLKELESRL